MADKTQADETTYELSDLEVVTLGLVERAAVGIYEDGANVFLLKHDKESPMPDELDIEQVDETTPEQDLSKSDQNLLQKFLTFLKGEVAKANPVALQQAARILTAGGYPVTAAKLASLLGSDKDEDYETEMSGKKADKVAKSDTELETTEGGTEPVSETNETVVSKALEDRLAEIQKANDAWKETVEKALEEKYKGELEALQKQAEEAKTEVAKANEMREEQVWIEKAGSMTFALGADQKDLGKHLHTIARTAPAETVDYIVAVLKAADHALTEGDLFSEFGTTRTAEEVSALEKAQKLAEEKGISLAEAMLELPLADQAELTKGFKEDK
jgi:chromosome segregation and condensation protein ScpB